MIKVTQYIKPKAFVFTNIFRDQMDRYGEIYTTYQKIIDGVALAPDATIIANGDAPFSILKTYQTPLFTMVQPPGSKPRYQGQSKYRRCFMSQLPTHFTLPLHYVQ
ncbi:hypothetical protein [Secundilactobacillus kimchicus]|uniref:hypothetical protein n=1 Tax=Secundilactobacillus kimchicus TaxID=528209 RepID=UPI002436546F|nr:hypothetical protein [Secundilactobacillus kimchicus]